LYGGRVDCNQWYGHLFRLGGTEALQKEMQRLEDDIVGSAGVSEKLEQDFDAIEKFFHDLFCGLDPKCRQGN
jgi:hypothetical protein